MYRSSLEARVPGAEPDPGPNRAADPGPFRSAHGGYDGRADGPPHEPPHGLRSRLPIEKPTHAPTPEPTRIPMHLPTGTLPLNPTPSGSTRTYRPRYPRRAPRRYQRAASWSPTRGFVVCSLCVGGRIGLPQLGDGSGELLGALLGR